jgi:phosphoenolpyruvate carboxylase
MSAWNPTNLTGLHPTARPSEKRQDIEFSEKDAQLRRDVHELGVVVGELLREQCGDEMFRTVEAARRTAIGRREGDAQASAELDAIL